MNMIVNLMQTQENIFFQLQAVQIVGVIYAYPMAELNIIKLNTKNKAQYLC